MNNFSNSFGTNGNEDIDMKFLSSKFDHFLFNSFNLAILLASGNCASFVERLIKDVIGTAIITDSSFRNLPAKLSIQTALLGFFSSSNFEIT